PRNVSRVGARPGELSPRRSRAGRHGAGGARSSAARSPTLPGLLRGVPSRLADGSPPHHARAQRRDLERIVRQPASSVALRSAVARRVPLLASRRGARAVQPMASAASDTGAQYPARPSTSGGHGLRTRPPADYGPG